jgi:tripartite-type tricarboxylate transporter receptor subunit TctC
MRHSLLRCLFVLLSVLACAGTLAQAASTGSGQAYPSRPIRIVVPYTPGGFTDVTTRIVSVELSKAVGQSVIIDNRPGANSIVGVEIVAKSNPDGYTIAAIIPAHAANQTLYPKLPYHSVNSFAPVSLAASAPLILCVTNSLPARSVKELVALAKSRPGKLSFASSGVGASAHLSMELLMMMTGISMVHVPYKGTAPALVDLTSGQVQVMFDVPSSMLPHAKAGRIRALAMASEKRYSAAPELPTISESAVPGYASGSWVGFIAPAGAPREAVARLGKEIMNIVKRPDVRERFIEIGIEPVGNSPAEFTAFLKNEVSKWEKVIRTANVKIEQ